jgi:hypothetical protein
VNQATVSGGGDPTDASSNDSVTVNAGRDLAITKTHAGNFFQARSGRSSRSAYPTWAERRRPERST